MKRLLTFAIVALISITAAAQNRSKVIFYLLDEQTKQPLQGAVVEVVPKAEPSDKSYYTTGKGGYMEFSVPMGEYRIVATFIGYADKHFACNANGAVVELGNIFMRESATKIDAVVKEVQQFRTTQNADTLIYNAAAFKTTKDAEAEKLLSKMPGVVVEEGQVEVQGEQIKKVFVDGDEFFGDDVTMAIKNIPAEIVDKVEVFDKLSDEAEFSGIDDGESYKALNFVTKKSMRNGQFGKLYAGLGWQPEADKVSFNPKYIAGGNFNSFRNKQKITVLGLFNNINQQNFSFEDLLGVNSSGRGGRGSNQFMVRPQPGVAFINAVGINYSDTWGRRKNVKFQGSYFFNNTNTRNLSERTTWYEYPAPYGTQYALAESEKVNNNHRLNARIDWKISRRQQLTSRTTLSYQGNRPTTVTKGYSNNGTDLDTLGMEDISFRPLSYTASRSENIMRGINANEFLQYRLRLGAPGRTMTITARAGYRDNRATRNIMTNNAEPIPFGDPRYEQFYNDYFSEGVSWRDMEENPALFVPIYEYRNVPTYTYNIRGGLNYNEPIARNWTLTAQYNVVYRNQSKVQGAWYTDKDYIVNDESRRNEALTINSSTNTLTHRVGPGIRYSKKRNTLVLRVMYENLSRNGSFENGANTSSLVNKQYHSVQYHAMFRYAFNKQNSLRIQFRSNSDAPSVSQLHNIFDVASPQNISVGNYNLSPEYSHSGSIRYILSLPDKGQTFMAMIRGEYYQNAISGSTLYNSKGWTLPDEMNGIYIPKDENGKAYRPTQITSYENISGLWSVRANVSYGVPLPFMKCNLNMTANVGYSVTPSAVYNAGSSPAELLENVANHKYSINKANNIGYTFRLALGSNISENIDFTISWRGTYNQAWNSATEATYGEKIINDYFRHTASASVKWIFGPGFTLTANAAYHQYIGFENNYNEQYILCNLYLGKQLFKNRRGEIQIGVNDILNQNTAFSRSTGSGFTRNVLNSTVGRYVMVQFVYNLRHFGKNASRNISDYEGMDGKGNRPYQGGMSGMRQGGRMRNDF